MFSNYSRVMDMIPFMKGVGNTVLVEVSVVAIGTFVTAMAEFSFAKLKLKFKTTLLLILMSGMMVPYAVLMLPQIRAFMALNMYDTLWPLILPGFFGNVTMMFFFIQYMKGIPSAFFEAAKIDGAGYGRIFVGFILPLAMPAIVAQGLLSFMGCWNNYMGSYIFITGSSVWVNLPHAMTIMNSGTTFASDQGPILAAAVMCVLPVIILFAIFQKMIIGSLMLTGSKE